MRRSTLGFTMIEVLVAAAISGIAIAGAFAFARYQIVTYKTQGDVSAMQVSSNVVFESLAKDLRNAGFGTSFWVGATQTAFGGRLTYPRGLPAIRPLNAADQTNGAIMRASDAIMVLRLEGASTFIPATGAGVREIPGEFNAGTNVFTVSDPSQLEACANTDIDQDGTRDGIVLVSDMVHRSEPGSFLLAINQIVGATPGTPGTISFATAYGIDPADSARVNEQSPSTSAILPKAGPGSTVVCARPVVYWVDSTSRLRMWRASSASPSGSGAAAQGAFGSLPIDPGRDVVLAEGVEDLQISYLMSSAAPGGLGGQWLFSAGANSVADAANPIELAEMRSVRVTAVLRTARTVDIAASPNVPAAIEDRAWPTQRTPGCADPTACFDPAYGRKVVRMQSELRSLRLFDLMSSGQRTTADIRSFMQ